MLICVLDYCGGVKSNFHAGLCRGDCRFSTDCRCDFCLARCVDVDESLHVGDRRLAENSYLEVTACPSDINA